jgi:hypothetical protein
VIVYVIAAAGTLATLLYLLRICKLLQRRRVN